ncbi:hypothetical protein Zm00014a_044259 [Zea mays]|uniref:Uncharacterized protein n=1 Tax=Zea mays TaxID=4577 RepID=A0A3L6FV67_MAIZE|nr:hypothetical protein Zm00014a_044259 [Zea mays]
MAVDSTQIWLNEARAFEFEHTHSHSH